MAWWTATSVSVTNNTNIVTVNTGDDISLISPSSGLIIASNIPVEVNRTYLNGSIKTIELKRNWTGGTLTNQAAVAYPTDADLGGIATAFSNYLAAFVVATQAQAEAGTDNVAAMTPQRVKQAIDFQRKEATNAEALAGTLQGVFMSPLRVMQLIQSSGILNNYIVGAETDLNAIGSTRVTRLFYTTDSALNRPTTDTMLYAGLQIAAQNNVCRQIVWCANTGVEKMYFRTGNGSPTMTWTAWREVLHSGNTVKQSSVNDTTAGALLAVGAFGWGTASNNLFSSFGLSLDATTIPSGTYRVSAADTGTKPVGFADFVLTHLRYNGTDSTQIATTIGANNAMFFRASTSGAWSAWKKVNSDLAVQSSILDTTPGSLLTVSSFGLGGGAINVADFTAAELNVNRWGRFLSTAVSKPPFMNAGAFITAQYDGTPTTYILGAGLKTDNNTHAAFFGKRSTAGAIPTWYELWDKTQAPVQANKQDTTANAVLQNGAYSIGTDYLQNRFATVVANGVWALIPQYVGGQTTLTNGWVYKVQLIVTNTGASNGNTYFITQTAVGTWVARKAGYKNESGVNHPTLRITAGNTIELAQSGTASQAITILMQAWYTGNVTIQNPAWFGVEPYLSRDFTNGYLILERAGTDYKVWDAFDKPDQSNRYDKTTNAMLRAGSFGWGTETFADGGFTSNTTYLADANAVTVSGAYATGIAWTGSPVAGTNSRNQGCLLHMAWGTTSYAVQIFYGMQTDHANHQIRFKDNGVWSAWQKFLTTDSLSAPAQANIYDTAANALLRAGSFGLGTANLTVVTTDADALRVSGIYRVGASWTGSPILGTSSNNQGVLTHRTWVTNYAVQEFHCVVSKTHYIRYLSNAVWSTWDVMYNSTNALSSVSNVSGQNTGGLMEYGSNANGVYYKYADGRLECIFNRGTIALTANTEDAYTWTFPATFAAAPSMIDISIGGASVTNAFNVNKETFSGQTTTSVIMRVNVSVSQNHNLCYRAIGRWR